MKRVIPFKNIPNDILEKCYHQYIQMEIKRDIVNIEQEPLLSTLECYKKDIGEKGAYAIMTHELLMEIAKRWINRDKMFEF